MRSLAWANTDVTYIHIEMGSSIKISQCDCEQCNASVVRQIYWLVPIFPLHKKHIILLDSPLYYNFRQSFLIWFGVFVLDSWLRFRNQCAHRKCVCVCLWVYIEDGDKLSSSNIEIIKKGNARVCWNVAKWNADTPAFGGYLNNPTLSAYRRKFIIYDTFAHSHSSLCRALPTNFRIFPIYFSVRSILFDNSLWNFRQQF